MKSHEFINEAAQNPQSGDYQRMLDFVNTNKTPGVPPDQQIALAMFRELDKQKQQNNQLGAELRAAEERIDIATQGGELAKSELGKHQGELERERGNMQQQRDQMGKIDQERTEREMASAEQLQNLTARFETIKNKPGVSPDSTKELEKQMQELQKNGVDIEKYKSLEQSVANMQKMQQVDDRSMQSLIGQVKAAQDKADELSQTRADVSGEVEQSTGAMQDEIDQLKQQLARFREVEQTVSALQPMVQDVLAPKVNQLYKRQQAADGVDPRAIGKSLIAKGGLGPSAQAMLTKVRQAQQPAQPAPAPTPVAEDKLFKLIKWATGK
jgi:chromosome segregation ATPase